ncbi:lipoprotein [Streptomyces ficellus]|uniref:Lipoprotein n=1 Tax=Streptomyces ficellus TaxID=1977088 RepID=A0ABT7Z0R0_9ACTN|nr:lipoprotein [Streptomyces ficellus]MDN3293078.1 lipoprotein [Streptomyces ficellus]
MGRYGMRGVAAMVVLVVAGGLAAGCAAEGAGPAAKPSGSVRAAAQPKRLIGGAGTPCALPVSFETAPEWTAEAVTSDPAIGVLDQGPVVLACEIDAKPAGNIGFLRVWTGEAEAAAKGATPREILEGFIAADTSASKARYRDVEAGRLPAAEVTYTVSGEFQDEPKTERALAVTTPRGAVVVHLGGLDTAEHQQMLPAYELARRTMAVTD